MDRAQEQEMILNCDVAAAVLAVGGGFRLVALDSTPVPDFTAGEWKGARFVGCLALTKGRVSVSLDDEMTLENLRIVSAAFHDLVTPKPDSETGWLERLWNLPDTRQN